MDDIAGEILVRLPVESLARCKALSKNAYTFISGNAYFRQNYLSRNPGCSIMFGLFHTVTRPYKNHVERVHFFPTTTQGRRSNSSSSFTSFPICDKSLSFLGLGDDQPIHIAGSSNGFLLCTLQLNHPVNYIICNPITKQWLSLPNPSYNSEYAIHGFLWQSADHYTVVRAMESDDPDTALMIEIFSPQTSSQQWKLLNLICPFSFTLDMYLVSAAIIKSDGVIYLPANLQIQPTQSDDDIHSLLIIDQREKESQCLKRMEFPQPETDSYNSKLFGQSNQHILYAIYEQAFLRLKVFLLDENTTEWSLMYNVGLEMTPEHYHDDLDIMAFHPTNPQLLILKCHPELVLYNLGNSTLEFICDFYEQGWPCDYYTYPYTYGLTGPHLFFDS